ncbi:MAG: HAD family hydrolase [Saprospiraceae bacterium]|nr:HAD family hydrolase [Saprospiraceae bacterium]
MKVKLVIFDFNRTLLNHDTQRENVGATELLKEIKENKIDICIVSRKEAGNIDREKLLYQQDYIRYVNKIYFTKGNISKKSNYKKAMQSMECLPSETLVVGDYLMKDIKPAIELGCITVWFKKGKFASETPAITGIYPTDTVEELIDLLKLIK